MISFPSSDANKKLQDTNDHIQGMVDMPSIGEERERERWWRSLRYSACRLQFTDAAQKISTKLQYTGGHDWRESWGRNTKTREDVQVQPYYWTTLLNHTTEPYYWTTLMNHTTEPHYWTTLLNQTKEPHYLTTLLNHITAPHYWTTKLKYTFYHYLLITRSKQSRGSRSPSDFDGSGTEGDSLRWVEKQFIGNVGHTWRRRHLGLHLVLFRYREMNRAKLSEVNFGIKRLMEDLGKRMIINDIAADIANWKSFSDSGHSTLPGDDCDDLGRWKWESVKWPWPSLPPVLFRNAFFHPTNLGSELESALEEGGLGSLEEEVGHDQEELEGGLRGRSLDRSRKVSMLDRSGRRFLETSRSPFRHSFVDVRVQLETAVWSDDEGKEEVQLKVFTSCRLTWTFSGHVRTEETVAHWHTGTLH